jgi:hypothetical protein
MQPNQITLAVDELNDSNTVNHIFDRYEEYLNRSVYVEDSMHSMEARDSLGLYRTFPKVNGNFKGVSKSSIKFTKDITVDGVDGVSQLTSPIIVEVSFSLPVGCTPAQAMIARQKVIALLDSDTHMAPLNDQLVV